MKDLLKSDPGDFRIWVLHLYEEHKKERDEFLQKPLSFKEYWNQYKFWLRKKYREENPFI